MKHSHRPSEHRNLWLSNASSPALVNTNLRAVSTDQAAVENPRRLHSMWLCVCSLWLYSQPTLSQTDHPLWHMPMTPQVRLRYIVPRMDTLFLFMAVWKCHTSFIHSSCDGHPVISTVLFFFLTMINFELCRLFKSIFKIVSKWDIVVRRAYICRAQEAEAGGSRVWGQPELHGLKKKKKSFSETEKMGWKHAGDSLKR